MLDPLIGFFVARLFKLWRTPPLRNNPALVAAQDVAYSPKNPGQAADHQLRQGRHTSCRQEGPSALAEGRAGRDGDFMGKIGMDIGAGPRTLGTSRPSSLRAGARRVLAGVELFTGGSALLCGALLMIRPDGSLLGLPTSALVGGPFTDWRLPGFLLAGLVGVGYLAASAMERGRYRFSSAVSALAGVGLIVFEGVEWRWLGFHPLQAVFMGVGAAVVTIAVADVRHRSSRP